MEKDNVYYDESGLTITTGSTGDISITTDFINMSNDTTINMNTNDIITATIDSNVYSDLFFDDGITLTLNDPVEFEDHMPSVSKVEDMCNDYPALAKAYENFKTIYAMVHQDWKGRQEDEPPF